MAPWPIPCTGIPFESGYEGLGMKNALICFLKYPEPGHVKTRLAKDLGEYSAANIYRAMAERVITEVYPLENSYDLLLYADPTHSIETFKSWIGESWSFREQQGSDLGQRLNAAVNWAFEAEYQRVAVIGSDCVGMDQAFIEEMFSDLANNDFIIGPSTDGGYYLLGLSQPSSWLFEGIEWSTNSVLETTIDKIEMRDFTVKQLQEKIDVDTLEDLLAFKESLPLEHYLVHKIEQIALDRVTLDSDAEKFFQ